MKPSEICPDCDGMGFVPVATDDDVKPCHCTKEHDGDGPED